MGITESGITESGKTQIVEIVITETGITESGITWIFKSGIRYNGKLESVKTESGITRKRNLA